MFWSHDRLEAGYDAAFPVNEELGEVPLDVRNGGVVGVLPGEHPVHELARVTVSESSERFLGVQPLEDLIGIFAVHVGLGHQREGDAVIQAAEFLNFLIRAGLLVTELVTGEADDHEALVTVLLIKGFQPVILRGETAFGGGVDNQENLSLVLGEGQFFAFVRLGGKVVNGRHLIGAGNGANRSQNGKYLLHGCEVTNNPPFRQIGVAIKLTSFRREWLNSFIPDSFTLEVLFMPINQLRGHVLPSFRARKPDIQPIGHKYAAFCARTKLFGQFEGRKNLGSNAFHAFNVGMAGFLFDVVMLEEGNAIHRKPQAAQSPG